MSKDRTPTTDARIVSKLPEGDYSPQVNLQPSQLHTFPEEISQHSLLTWATSPGRAPPCSSV